MANSVDPYQTAPIEAVCSGSTLFASILNLSVISDFIWPFLRPYMGVIPNPKMAFIFPISCILAIIFPILIKYFPKCVGKGSFPKSQIKSLVMFGNYLQQTTSADNIFRCISFLCALRVNNFSGGGCMGPGTAREGRLGKLSSFLSVYLYLCFIHHFYPSLLLSFGPIKKYRCVSGNGSENLR